MCVRWNQSFRADWSHNRYVELISENRGQVRNVLALFLGLQPVWRLQETGNRKGQNWLVDWWNSLQEKSCFRESVLCESWYLFVRIFFFFFFSDAFTIYWSKSHPGNILSSSSFRSQRATVRCGVFIMLYLFNVSIAWQMWFRFISQVP